MLRPETDNRRTLYTRQLTNWRRNYLRIPSSLPTGESHFLSSVFVLFAGLSEVYILSRWPKQTVQTTFARKPVDSWGCWLLVAHRNTVIALNVYLNHKLYLCITVSSSIGKLGMLDDIDVKPRSFQLPCCLPHCIPPPPLLAAAENSCDVWRGSCSVVDCFSTTLWPCKGGVSVASLADVRLLAQCRRVRVLVALQSLWLY